MSERGYAFLRRVESNSLTYDFAVGKNSNGKIGSESSHRGVVTTALRIFSVCLWQTCRVLYSQYSSGNQGVTAETLSSEGDVLMMMLSSYSI